MSLGVSDNVLLEAHNDGQNSQYHKLIARKMLLAKMYGISFFYGRDGKFNVSGQILHKRLARAKHCGEARKFRILSLEGFERTWLQLGGSAVGGG